MAGGPMPPLTNREDVRGGLKGEHYAPKKIGAAFGRTDQETALTSG